MMPSPPLSLDTRSARRLLAFNAVFTSACALPMVLASGDIAHTLFGSDDWSAIVASVGVALLGYAAMLSFARAQPAPKMRLWLLGFSAGDALWVLSTALLLHMMPTALTPTGHLAAALIAAIVGWFGLSQLRMGLAR